MKITSVELTKRDLRSRSDLYTVQSPGRVYTAVDNDNNIVDCLPSTAIRYTIDEAEALIAAMKKAWPDYKDDPYYKQGTPCYPVYMPVSRLRPLDIKKFTRAISIYRHKVAGEWIYGLTNHWTGEGAPYRAVEASMDAWEKWLIDRHAILQNKWIAENIGDID